VSLCNLHNSCVPKKPIRQVDFFLCSCTYCTLWFTIGCFITPLLYEHLICVRMSDLSNNLLSPGDKLSLLISLVRLYIHLPMSLLFHLPHTNYITHVYIESERKTSCSQSRERVPLRIFVKDLSFPFFLPIIHFLSISLSLCSCKTESCGSIFYQTPWVLTRL